MIESIFLTIGIFLILYAFYEWATMYNGYFKEKGVRYLKPVFLFGNTFGLFAKQYSQPGFIHKLYNAFPGEKIYGLFDFRKPFYVVRDPDVIKQLTIKDFEYFMDHRSFLEDNTDQMFGNSLVMLHGEKWHEMRSTLSPAFTGSKMRQMFELVTECAEDMSTYFLEKCKNGQRINLEMKDTFSRITNDIIATCAFGIKIDSFRKPNNEFYVTGISSISLTSAHKIIKLILLRMIPSVMRFFNIEFTDIDIQNFFKSMVMDNIETRDKQGIFRPDMINILMQIMKGKNLHDNTTNKDFDKISTDGFATVEESNIRNTTVSRKWSDMEIVSQCFLFFIAGFDTSSTLLSFAAYELATNLDIQQRLYEEICDTNEKLKGQRISYDAIQKMQYMDMVISETLRKWPPAPFTDRVCIKDYHYDDGEQSFKIEKGMSFWIPIYGLHRDPEYFPNPEKFNPDRFSEENRTNINLATYIPFGIGPRNCIGSRFALMEVKAILYYILFNFELIPNEKTVIPLELIKTPVLINFKNGMNLEMKHRKITI